MVVKASSSELERKDPTQLIALSFARAVVPLSIRDRDETVAEEPASKGLNSGMDSLQ